jgi:hypothetical protein
MQEDQSISRNSAMIPTVEWVNSLPRGAAQVDWDL